MVSYKKCPYVASRSNKLNLGPTCILISNFLFSDIVVMKLEAMPLTAEELVTCGIFFPSLNQCGIFLPSLPLQILEETQSEMEQLYS